MGSGAFIPKHKANGEHTENKSKVNKGGLGVIDSLETGLFGYVDRGLSGREISDRFNSLDPTRLAPPQQNLSAFISHCVSVLIFFFFFLYLQGWIRGTENYGE